MSRPKFFRDPIHVQLRFAPVDLRRAVPSRNAAKRQSWLLRRLIDSSDFQRLRLIRQTGLANLVFHGAEHSRFNHSMGVLYLARQMYKSIVRNMDEAQEAEHELSLAAAALLHDVGHGPFSHTLEEILRGLNVDFHHERMTMRFLLEEGSEVNQILVGVDPQLPKLVGAHIDHKMRSEDSWRYKIVSSQLDADRLDYLCRDAYYCGLRGHGFDRFRILDLLQHHQGKCIGVDDGALEAVEAYLVTLDQLYRAIYYHHAVRAANCLLTSTLRRAVSLYRGGDRSVLRKDHPLRLLVDKGQGIELSHYARLGEHHVWVLVDEWREHKDEVLRDLARRLLARELFKTKEVPMVTPQDFKDYEKLRARVRELTIKNIGHVSEDTVEYYVCEDAPDRTSYKSYNWKPESVSDSIWIVSSSGQGKPIEDEERSPIVQGLKQHTHYFPRLMMPSNVRELLKST